MAIYEYQCDTCAATFQGLKPIARRDDADCPDCPSGKGKRLTSLPAPAVIPYGASGWANVVGPKPAP